MKPSADFIRVLKTALLDDEFKSQLIKDRNKYYPK